MTHKLTAPQRSALMTYRQNHLGGSAIFGATRASVAFGATPATDLERAEKPQDIALVILAYQTTHEGRYHAYALQTRADGERHRGWMAVLKRALGIVGTSSNQALACGYRKSLTTRQAGLYCPNAVAQISAEGMGYCTEHAHEADLASALLSINAGPGISHSAAIMVEDTAQLSRDGRPVYEWTIRLPDGSEHSAADLHGPVCGREPSEREMLGTLCSFLGAEAEAYDYIDYWRDGNDRADALFPTAVVSWASQYSDELAMLQLSIDEGAE